MKLHWLLLFIGTKSLTGHATWAQTRPTVIADTSAYRPNKLYTYVEQMPSFPGGQAALFQTIGQTLYYPTEALQQGLAGKVYVGFVVGTSGRVQDVKVSRSVHPLLDAEAVRAISMLPAFTPGRQNGRPVPVSFTLPIGFRLPPNVKQILAERAKADSTSTH